MPTLAAPADQFTLHIQKESIIAAPLATVFTSILEQYVPDSKHPDGTPMPMKLEPWPGGRWFRDLGNNTGHFWGHVQVIKPPTFLELCGPMFMSYAAVNHVQFRLTEESRNTKLTLIHRAFGDIAPEHREGVNKGWAAMLEMIKARAQR